MSPYSLLIWDVERDTTTPVLSFSSSPFCVNSGSRTSAWRMRLDSVSPVTVVKLTILGDLRCCMFEKRRLLREVS